MPTTNSPEQRVFSTPQAIRAACSKLIEGQEVKVTFKPITDPVWLSHDKAAVVDSDGEDIPSTVLPKLIQHLQIEGSVDSEYSGGPTATGDFTLTVIDEWGEDTMFGVSPKYIETLVLGPAPFVPDGMDHNITVTDKIRISGGDRDRDGEEIGKAEALNILRTLAERFKCKVTVSSKSVALIPVKPAPAAADPKVKKMAATPAPVKFTTATQIAGAVKPYIDAPKGSKGKFAKGKFLVKFKPITDPCWLRNGATRPADGEFNGAHLTSIVANQTMSFARLSRAYGCWRFDDGNGSLYVNANQIVELTVPPAPASTSAALRFEDVRETCTWANDSGLKIGCQNITGNGVMELLLILAKFSGYTVNNPVGIAAANKISKFNLVDATAKLRLDPADTTPTPAKK